MKLWGGVFSKASDSDAEKFNNSLDFDCRLYRQDIAGSIAHARMLGQCGIISPDESKVIMDGLNSILTDIENGALKFTSSDKTDNSGNSDTSYNYEDIHSFVESILVSRIGNPGRKLHTARSRNDQVALDIRLYLRGYIDDITIKLKSFMEILVSISEQNLNTIMPGYTHLQRAQPITLAHHMMAYFQMFRRDAGRLIDCRKRLNLMPLGSGALAGTTFPIDRHAVAIELGFDDITQNSLDSVSDRDFAIELLSALSIIMMHLSRLSEEIILWSSQEFGFAIIDEAFSTGSSIMPQKKNPDIAELTRGKSGRVYGSLVALLSIMKSLPLAYNKDMQEDKEALFDAADTVSNCIKVFSGMLASVKYNKTKMKEAAGKGFANSTDAADYLARKGVPFREAHETTGKIISYCIENSKTLEELSLEEYKQFSVLIGKDIYGDISLEKCVSARNTPGGPAPSAVMAQINEARSYLHS